jgi:hypothetical protein
LSKKSVNPLVEAAFGKVVDKVRRTGTVDRADLQVFVNQTLEEHPKATKTDRQTLVDLSVQLRDDEARRLGRLGITLAIVGIVLAVAGIVVPLVVR